MGEKEDGVVRRMKMPKYACIGDLTLPPVLVPPIAALSEPGAPKVVSRRELIFSLKQTTRSFIKPIER